MREEIRHLGNVGADTDGVHIGDLLRTLWLGKWTMAACAALGAAVAIWYAFFVAVPVYRATAVVILT